MMLRSNNDPSERPAPAIHVAEPIDRFVRLPEVCVIVGMSPSGIYKLMSLDRFPKNVRITRKCVAWRLSEVRRWQGTCPEYRFRGAK